MTTRRDLNSLPLNQRVAAMRRRRGWSQAVLAARAGRSKSWIEKIERGVRVLYSVDSRRVLANALGVDEGLLGHQITVQRYKALFCHRCEGTFTNARLQHTSCPGQLAEVFVTITLADSEPGDA